MVGKRSSRMTCKIFIHANTDRAKARVDTAQRKKVGIAESIPVASTDLPVAKGGADSKAFKAVLQGQWSYMCQYGVDSREDSMIRVQDELDWSAKYPREAGQGRH